MSLMALSTKWPGHVAMGMAGNSSGSPAHTRGVCPGVELGCTTSTQCPLTLCPLGTSGRHLVQEEDLCIWSH